MKRIIVNENMLKRLVLEAIKDRSLVNEDEEEHVFEKTMYGYNLYGCGSEDIDIYSRERWEDMNVAYHKGFDALKEMDTSNGGIELYIFSDFKGEIHFNTPFRAVVKRRDGTFRNFNEDAYNKGVDFEMFGVVK